MIHTNPHQPSISLVRRICYPESYKFSCAATSYGCKHEEDARDEYKSRMIKGHTGIKINPCGFFVDVKRCYIGASPDGLVECTCCGKEVIEIKCPSRARNADSFDDVAEQRKPFCLQKTVRLTTIVTKPPILYAMPVADVCNWT